MQKKISYITYQCTICGKTETKSSMQGRPSPGMCKQRSGMQPHRWVISMKR